jgi:hypothetical protein
MAATIVTILLHSALLNRLCVFPASGAHRPISCAQHHLDGAWFRFEVWPISVLCQGKLHQLA